MYLDHLCTTQLTNHYSTIHIVPYIPQVAALIIIHLCTIHPTGNSADRMHELRPSAWPLLHLPRAVLSLLPLRTRAQADATQIERVGEGG
jgi:hypothetical protein